MTIQTALEALFAASKLSDAEARANAYATVASRLDAKTLVRLVAVLVEGLEHGSDAAAHMAGVRR